MNLSICRQTRLSFEGALGLRHPYRAAILHTNGGGPQLQGWFDEMWNAPGGNYHAGIGAHFQVYRDGHADQLVDTERLVWHAYGASVWAVGIETEDDGNPGTPWTGQQVGMIVNILHELEVPARMLPTDQPADGIGYHQQYPSWNLSGHACPGGVRKAQIMNEVVPLLAKSYEVTPPKPVPPKPKPKPLIPVVEDVMAFISKNPAGNDQWLCTPGAVPFPAPPGSPFHAYAGSRFWIDSSQEWAAALADGYKIVNLDAATFESFMATGPLPKA